LASGDITSRTAGSITALLLDAVATGATNNGAWVEVPDGYGSGTVTVVGPATTTVVTINGLNDVSTIPPAAATVGAVMQTGAAGATVFGSFAALPRFIKCAITATGTGTVTATLQARRST